MGGSPVDSVTVEYRFRLPEGRTECFTLQFDPGSFELRRAGTALPDWTALEYNRCAHCPLDPATTAHCPLAAGIADVVGRFDDIVSHHELDLEVVTCERRVIQRTTAQRAISSLMGLLSASSGCPHTAFFRPMARFHLPLSTEVETTYRVASMYLLGEYLSSASGGGQLKLDGIERIYERVHAVNVAMARRLRAATSTDSSVNALVMLDVFAMGIPFSVDETLEQIRGLFGSHLLRSACDNPAAGPR
jgi:hypothetical protein